VADTTRADAAGKIAPLADRDLRRVTVVLCASQITTWGVLFYAFPVLATRIAEEEGWSITTMMAGFTGAQVMAAVLGIWVGRHLDQRGPRAVMTLGSAVGIGAVVAFALAPTLPWFLAAWALAGAAMSASLYPPAFAAATHWGGDRRVAALTAVTLVGGLASTLYAPLTAVLEDARNWRATYLVLAVPLALTLPLHWHGLRHPWVRPAAAPSTHAKPAAATHRDPLLRTPAFLLVLVAMTMAGFSIYAGVINLVPLLVEDGLTTEEGALALAVGGIGQVTGRLAYGRTLGKADADAKLAVVLLVTSAATLVLAAVPRPLILLFAVTFIAGTARGAFTLTQATAVTDRWGTSGYAARSGVLSGGVGVAAASAPWLGAVAATTLGGYDAAFAISAATALAAVCVVLGGRAASQPTRAVSARRSGARRRRLARPAP
jgi:predicted MFS family arabinose efflux permease